MLALSITAQAQFQILDAKSTASLRGIDAVSPQIAWASGSSGTVLLTTDGGATWKHCTTPAGAEKLDFRGVQGFDAQTAVIMASGKGPASAIYKTTDGCATWKLVFSNPDPEGFFDALRKAMSSDEMWIVGDPVRGKFATFSSRDAGETWKPANDPGREALKDAGGFAASNSGLTANGPFMAFGTSATAMEPPRIYTLEPTCVGHPPACPWAWKSATVPMLASGTSSGVFSVAAMWTGHNGPPNTNTITVVAVGGDYAKPAERAGAAAFSEDGGEHWQLAATMPGGYRSAVAFDFRHDRYIAVGPNGIDVSTDSGKNWMPLQPGPNDAPDADKNWNAISLPFVVGSKGKIGKLTAKF